MKISFTFPTEYPQDIPTAFAGTTMQGTQAIVFEGMPENPVTGFPRFQSGWQLIRKTLDDRYGRDTQDITDDALDRFDECVHGGGALMDYITAFKLRYETAEGKQD